MGGTVLVVDDSAAIRGLLGVALRQAGYAVAEAGDGRAALERIVAGGVDLVVSDCIMPVLDGLGLAREIRSRPALARLPIIMLTTECSAERIQEARAIGVQAWIVKPFQPQQLVEAVQRFCSA
ncbi:MAG TPA: response regulator [bacterium]